MLEMKNTVLIIVDVQGKLANLMHEKELLFLNIQRIIKGAKVLGIPVLWTEQNPEGLGPTIPEIAELLSGNQPISKIKFSCCGSDKFMGELKKIKRKQVLITGIETHICVYQTAAELLEAGYEVQVVSDAVSSRTKENKNIGLQRMRHAGATLTSVETALYELLRTAEGEKFKEILKIIK